MTDRALELRRQLRRDSTDAEQALWKWLRGSRLGAKFRRQHSLGPFVADFYCAAARMVIELDGGQHYAPPGIRRDAQRTRWLQSRGLRVLRFSNLEVLQQADSVVQAILDALPLSPTLSPPSGARGTGRASTPSSGRPVSHRPTRKGRTA